MIKQYTFWLRTASIFQLLTGLIHSIGLFNEMKGTNETEEKMLDMMTTYKMDMGAGFSPSMMNLFIALSSCLTFLYILGGMNNLFLIKKLEAPALKGYLLINLVIFGASFGVNLFLTFLPPVILTGIVFVLLSITYFIMPSRSS
jgi:hypothetical protein